jgi:hypothetical protein
VSWVRIDDRAMTHPKIIGLSDKAFRLWVWGLAYAQQHLTDGLLPAAAIPARLARAAADLLAKTLWEARGADYQVHDYLDWNDSRALITAKRDGARQALKDHRDRRYGVDRRTASSDVKCISPPTTSSVRKDISLHTSENPLARSGVGKEKLLEEMDDGQLLDGRAGQLLEKYQELFVKHRQGARYHSRPHLDFPKACELVRTWTDDARLYKLAEIVLTTTDDWISRTDRGFGIFAARATWADDRLREWELKHGVAV